MGTTLTLFMGSQFMLEEGVWAFCEGISHEAHISAEPSRSKRHHGFRRRMETVRECIVLTAHRAKERKVLSA